MFLEKNSINNESVFFLKKRCYFNKNDYFEFKLFFYIFITNKNIFLKPVYNNFNPKYTFYFKLVDQIFFVNSVLKSHQFIV